MLGGLNPEQMAKVQAVSGKIKAGIKVDYYNNTFALGLSSEDPEAAALIPNLIKQFSEALAQQLSTFFQIKGEIVETGSPDGS